MTTVRKFCTLKQKVIIFILCILSLHIKFFVNQFISGLFWITVKVQSKCILTDLCIKWHFNRSRFWMFLLFIIFHKRFAFFRLGWRTEKELLFRFWLVLMIRVFLDSSGFSFVSRPYIFISKVSVCRCRRRSSCSCSSSCRQHTGVVFLSMLAGNGSSWLIWKYWEMWNTCHMD